MNNSWRELFLRIGNLKDQVLARWSMSNGAVFWFAIPGSAKVEGESFSDDVEFPFDFSEIISLEIPRSTGQGEFEIKNNLESVAAVLPISGLDIEVALDRVILTATAHR
jgi:hypothetical protein